MAGTEPLLGEKCQEATQSSHITQAAWQLENAIYDKELRQYPSDVESARDHHFSVQRADKTYSKVIVALIILTFLEVPAWCHETIQANPQNDVWSWKSGDAWCSVSAGNPNLSGVWYIPPGYGLVAEFIIEALILWKFFMQYRFDQRHFYPIGVEFHNRKITFIGCALALGSILDTVVFVWLRFPMRLTFVFRTGLIFIQPGVQHLFFCIFNRKMMTEFMSVAVFLCGAMLFFAWVAVTLFRTNFSHAYTVDGESVLVNKGFTNFGSATYSMFVAGITDEFVDILMPTFQKFRASGIIWAVFLVLAQVLLKNLVMDTFIAAYLKGSEEERKGTSSAQASGIYDAFKTLCLAESVEVGDENTEVPKGVFCTFVAELGRSPRMKPIPSKTVAAMYDQFGTITKDNWVDVCALVQNTFWVTKRDSCVYDRLQHNALYRWMHDKVSFPEESPAFDSFMNQVLAVNLVLVVVESCYNLNNWHEPAWMDNLELIFSVVYLLEVVVKLCVKSWREYWSTAANQFDFFTTVLLILTSLLQTEADLAHYANILRLLRLLRVVKKLKQYPQVQFMIFTVGRIMQEAGGILSLLGVTIFFFTNLSVNLFGGVLIEGDPRLEGTEYAEKHWFVLNFNDMFMAFAAWFVQLLTEYVPDYSAAVQVTSSWGDIAWLIFPLFYVISVAIIFELLLAFTVEVFMVVKEEFYEDKDDDEDEDDDDEDDESNGTAEIDFTTAGVFLESMQSEFEAKGLGLHYRISTDILLQRELMEAYQKASRRALKEEKGECNKDITKAAWIIEDASSGRHIIRYPENVEVAREHYIHVKKANRWYNKAIVALVILTLVEVPAWCHGVGVNPSMWSWVDGKAWCDIVDGQTGKSFNLYLSGFPYLPPGWSLIFEALIEALILRKFILEYKLELDHFTPVEVDYHNRWNIKLGCSFALCSLIDTAVFVLCQFPYRFTFLFRTGLLCLLPGVQRIFFCIFNKKMMAEFISVAVFFIGTVLFFAWIAVTIFNEMDDVAFRLPSGEAVPINKGFDTMRSAIYQMFLCGITDGFVDIFLPSFVAVRFYGILWLVFLLIAQVLLLNLVIDAFVAAYLNGSENDRESGAKLQANSMLKAFQSFGGQQTVTKEDFVQFVDSMGKSPCLSAIQPQVVEAIYDKIGTISQDTFCISCAIIQNRIWTTTRDSPLKSIPKLWESSVMTYFRRIVWEPKENPSFDNFMNWILLVNFLVVIVETYYNLNDVDAPMFMHRAERFFSVAYLIEVGVKLSVKSWNQYWSVPANQFDFFTTWLLLFTTLLRYLPIAALQADLARYANILRLLRLVRVVKQLKQQPRVQFMVATITRMVTASGDILSLLGVTMFFFTTLGVNFFGGVLYEGNPSLKGTGYDSKNWYIFNFNDVIMGFVTWFSQLLCEYVPEYAEALQKSSSWGDVAWWIFPLFYLVNVAILFEIVKAFTIEVYLGLKKAEEDCIEDEDEDEDDDIVAKQAAFLEQIQKKMNLDGEALHYRTNYIPTFQKELKRAYQECIKDEDMVSESKDAEE